MELEEISRLRNSVEEDLNNKVDVLRKKFRRNLMELQATFVAESRQLVLKLEVSIVASNRVRLFCVQENVKKLKCEVHQYLCCPLPTESNSSSG